MSPTDPQPCIGAPCGLCLDEKFAGYEPAMHRLTVRLLLVLTLVGTLAPVALAISVPVPHACCMRKPMHDYGSRSVEVQGVGGEHRNCCPPVTTGHWAQPGAGVRSDIHPLLAYLRPQPPHALRSRFENALRPVRGPPLS
jgi:hypothetical protein